MLPFIAFFHQSWINRKVHCCLATAEKLHTRQIKDDIHPASSSGLMLLSLSFFQEQLNMNATFGRWLPQNQQVQPQHQPPPPQPKSLPPREVQADKFKPSPPPAPQRSVVDEILSPSQLAPPPAAAVGPPPRKLSTAGSLEQPAPPNEAAPFQKVSCFSHVSLQV